MVVNSNTGMVFSAQYERYPRDETIEELFREVFSTQSVQRLYNEEQLRLRKSLETAMRRIGGWCEVAASLGVSWKNE
jgi:hypothetical protein